MSTTMRACARSLLAALALALGAASAMAEGAATVKDFGGAEAMALFGNYCSACHGWAASYAEIVDGTRVARGDPDSSLALAYIEDGVMPPSGEGPTAAERSGLRDWIAAGATPPADAVSAASGEADPAPSPLPAGFLGFPTKVAFHRAAGWTSAGLLLAAGVVGSVRAYTLMTDAHAYRDALGITEETMGTQCVAEIQGLWSADQALRWTHVGLLVAGESVYLANAVTGIGFLTPDGPGVTRSDLHRWGFFIHGGLMMAEAVMGFFTTEALRRGDHETVSSLGVAHAAVGLAIPLVIIASGSLMGR